MINSRQRCGIRKAARLEVYHALIASVVVVASVGACAQGTSRQGLGLDETETISEIVVTATKRSTQAFDYEGLVGVIDESELASKSITAIDDLGYTVAGLVFRQRGNRVYSNITLRGQSSVDLYSPKVQVYVDGFVQDQATYGLLLPNQISRVEVLYGPQGTLYGRGAVGGVLDVITRQPKETRALTLSARYGNLTEQFGLSAGVKGTSGWAADIAGTFSDVDVEYKALGSGELLGKREDDYVRARIAFGSDDSPWEASLAVTSSQIESTEEQYVPVSQLEGRRAVPVPNYYDLESDHYGFKLAYEFENFTVTSLTGYQDRDLDRTVFGFLSPEQQTTKTQEFRLTSTSDKAWSYTVGLYYESIDFKFSRPDSALISLQDIEVVSLFGETTWKISEKWFATFGLRADSYDVEAQGAVAAFAVTGKDDFSDLSPKFALGYQPNDSTRFYGIYSTGYKAGGFPRLVTPAIANFSYDPELAENFELGFKTRFWDRRADFSVAAYYTENDDFQLFVGIQPNQYLQNVGAAQSKGIDTNLQLLITEQLTVGLSYAWNRAKFTDYDNPLTPGIDLSGNALPHAPEHSLNVSLAYQMRLPGHLGSLTPSLHLNYVDDMFFDETNTVGENSLTMVKLNIGWALSDKILIEAYANNLTNETYTVYGFNGGPSLGELYQLGQGFEAGLRARVSF